LNAFALSFGVVFLAELGDKSQLVALALASRYRPLTVLVAVSIATLIVHAASVLVGFAFAARLPSGPIHIVAGLAFLAFALWTMRGDTLASDAAGPTDRAGRPVLLTVGAAFLLAELGDKTMLATIALATTQGPWGTWLGSTAGMVAADAIAIAVGAAIGDRLPQRLIRIGAALAFVAFGLVLVAEGLGA
jgi:putative Ca2+/H+ antiporter (TMEM165/GDT1 family)